MNSENWQEKKTLFHEAINLSADERAGFLSNACKGDDALRREVQDLLIAHDEAGDFISSPALVERGVVENQSLLVGKRIGHYEVLEELGRGGMGAVYLASRADESYDKKVAIKLIKRGMDTNAVLKRFVMERQILARLEHPNIASLIDGGSTTDGLPYLVMEYIEGEPITRYCDSNRLSIERRLRLFQKVCVAVSYAHQNLVVHRDIKPSNIFITKDGTPKLLDFGIAKLLDPDWSLDLADATATMFRVMTPEYASPEQLRGLPITTASDVYSLGVVLYELLSGERPYKLESRSLEEVAQIVLTQEPIKPSDAATRGHEDSGVRAGDSPATTKEHAFNNQTRTNKDQRTTSLALKGDLDNIILKSLRKEPERRYATVQEFSEDIRRHLEGLPVKASPDTFGYRARKFSQRHKAGVLAAAIVIITLLSAIGITTWQARVARRERDKAERRFNEVRKLANSVLFEYQDDIEKLPGSTPIRQKMIADALVYLDNLASESTGDASLQRELASAYEKVGNVQGNPFVANLGNQDGALASYRKALTIRETLYAANPTDAKIKYGLGTSYISVAQILWAKGENKGAMVNYQSALAHFSELAQADPKDKPTARNISVTLNGIGHVQTQSGDFKGALETYRKFLANAEALLAADATDKVSLHDVAIAHTKLGDALMDVADYSGALEQYEKSLEGFSALATLAENNALAVRLVGLTYSRLALVYNRMGQYEKAAEFNLKAIEQQRQLAAADPANVQIHFDIAATYGNLSDNYLQMKRLDDAVRNVREAIRIYTEALARNPDYSQGQGGIGNTYLTYAKTLLAKGDANAALENYRKALKILGREPVRSAETRSLAETYAGLGNVVLLRASQAKGDARQVELFKEARDWYQKSFDVWHELEQQGKVANEDKTNQIEIAQKIEQCRAALMKLKAVP